MINKDAWSVYYDAMSDLATLNKYEKSAFFSAKNYNLDKAKLTYNYYDTYLRVTGVWSAGEGFKLADNHGNKAVLTFPTLRVNAASSPQPVTYLNVIQQRGIFKEAVPTYNTPTALFMMVVLAFVDCFAKEGGYRSSGRRSNVANPSLKDIYRDVYADLLTADGVIPLYATRKTDLGELGLGCYYNGVQYNFAGTWEFPNQLLLMVTRSLYSLYCPPTLSITNDYAGSFRSFKNFEAERDNYSLVSLKDDSERVLRQATLAFVDVFNRGFKV